MTRENDWIHLRHWAQFTSLLPGSSWVHPFPENKHLEAIKMLSSVVLSHQFGLYSEEISSETTVNSLSFRVAQGMQTSQTFWAFLLTTCLWRKGFARCLCFLNMPKVMGTTTGLAVESKSPLPLKVGTQANAFRCSHFLLMGVTFKEHLSNICVFPSNH